MFWFSSQLCLKDLPPRLKDTKNGRSEEHTSELQSRGHLVFLHSFPTRRSSDLIHSSFRASQCVLSFLAVAFRMCRDESYRVAIADHLFPFTCSLKIYVLVFVATLLERPPTEAQRHQEWEIGRAHV